MILGTLMIIAGLFLATASGGATLLLVPLGVFWLWSEGRLQHHRAIEVQARADLEAAHQPVPGGGCAVHLLTALGSLVGFLLLLAVVIGALAGGG